MPERPTLDKATTSASCIVDEVPTKAVSFNFTNQNETSIEQVKSRISFYQLKMAI